jgi:hypothetical protein
VDKSNSLYAAISAIVSGILLSFVLHFPLSNPFLVPTFYSDIISFWGRQWVYAGQIPYVQSMFEYPTISGLILYSARMLGGSTIQGYYDFFGIFSFSAAIGVAWSSWKITKTLGKSLNPIFFLMPGIIIYGIYNFDLFHVLFILFSLQAFLVNRKSTSAAMLGLAIATKLTSIVLIPVYLLEIKGTNARLRFLSVIGAVIAVFNVPFILINFSTWFQTFTFLRNWGLEDAWYVWIFQNPASWDYAKYFGLGIMGLLLVRIYASKANLITKTFLALTAYLLGTYIYAPQFNLLLIPIIAILGIEDVSVYLWDAFNALIILTWFIYPNPVNAGSIPQAFALLRDVALVFITIVLLRREGLLKGSILSNIFQTVQKQSVLDTFRTFRISITKKQVQDH